MGLNRGKFSFPIPGRRSQKKTVKDDDASSNLSIPSAHERPSRHEEPSSKAHRVLGTSEPMYRATSKQSVPASPGYMSITVSEASFNSQTDDRTSATATDYNGYSTRANVSRRPSSNIIGRAYSGDGRRGSDYSTASHRLQPQTSNSTMRSHYDSKSSPLSISQQTSDSAVRDMALRRGKPQVVTDYNTGYIASPVSPVILDEARRKEQRKSKPARLDLSKLFPKPKVGEGHTHANALLSPTKMVNSPAAMSVSSDYQFPRPMTREPTPNPRGQVKLKTTSRQPVSASHTPSSPTRKFKRDEYDSAKVHIRRPPKGVQHWFDALDEDSDEDNTAPIYAPKAVRPNVIPKVPVRKTSLGRLAQEAATRSHHRSPANKKDTFTHEDLIDVCLESSSLVSLQSTKTKESALSKSNLQDSSVLSFSSSDDECDGSRQKAHRVAVRKSLVMNDDAGEIIIGQAQAFEVRPHRRPSAMSTLSTSTNAATIEVMYTPEPPFSPFHYPRSSNYSDSRRSSHARHPSVIPEDEDIIRPKTAINMPLSPSAHSIRSARTSASEPKPRSEGSRKLMAVTAEEEALLEMMRKKRAAMAKKGTTQPDQATQEQDRLHQLPAETSQHHYRTSGFLAEASPVRVVEAKAIRRASAMAPSPSPLLLTPRGRPLKAHYDANIGQSQLRDSSASDAWSEHQGSPARRVVIPHHLPTPSEFSPLDPFPPSSPVPTASVATTEHASPLPSPITPGLRAYEDDVNVKVASSDTSNDSEEVAIMDTGVIDAPHERVKSSTSSHDMSSHRRRRTASSGAAVSFPVPPTHSLTDLTPVSKTLSRAPSVADPAVPKLPQATSKRISGLTLLTSGTSRSRQGSVHSSHSQSSHTSSFMHGIEKRNSKRVSRQSSAASMNTAAKEKRNSVSDDVLAAWNSLGGTY
ncbi:hypothetical protein CC86DRAFT_367337 [Ophiobolus disseminans]|uniref:Uncharacterized protein n=1 Tax=Ophiobolus disseminans TaxID=1469910 RepID=A0A6A7AD35_9PLEO|nr:hypothetical protein CC86DRAFT_367337 [Ophiobolus disseminans]